MQTRFLLHATDSNKFPYRLTIITGQKILFQVRAQDKRPGQKGHIFCVRVSQDNEHTVGETITDVPVIALKQYGKRVSLVLDRSKNKRCDFLILKKKYKSSNKTYEQIFWRTQQGLTSHKSKYKLSTYHHGQLHILIDSSEKYAWSFGNEQTEKTKLPAGDYGLLYKQGLIAVVERKTFDNIISDISNMGVLHQKLNELNAYKHRALVIEAHYHDFFKEEKVQYYKADFMAKVFAEIQAYHPTLPIIFVGNRKQAQQWTHRFFGAVQANIIDQGVFQKSMHISTTTPTQLTTPAIKQIILQHANSSFTLKDCHTFFDKNISNAKLKSALKQLVNEDKLTKEKIGVRNYWTKKTVTP